VCVVKFLGSVTGNAFRDVEILYYSKTSNQPTPWIRVFLEKLIFTQLAKKFPAIYGTRKFVTVLTRARNWSLS
jgi:hypothetical protein